MFRQEKLASEHTQDLHDMITTGRRYAQSYPVSTGAFQNPTMTAPEYVLARGQPEGYGQVPRSAAEYEMYAAPTGGRGTLQSPNQGQFASQQGTQPAPYQDPRTGQLIYPPTSAGRGFDSPARHPGPADGRRR